MIGESRRVSESLGSFEASLSQPGRGWVDMGESLCESGRVWETLNSFSIIKRRDVSGCSIAGLRARSAQKI